MTAAAFFRDLHTASEAGTAPLLSVSDVSGFQSRKTAHNPASAAAESISGSSVIRTVWFFRPVCCDSSLFNFAVFCLSSAFISNKIMMTYKKGRWLQQLQPSPARKLIKSSIRQVQVLLPLHHRRGAVRSLQYVYSRRCGLHTLERSRRKVLQQDQLSLYFSSFLQLPSVPPSQD